VKVQKEMPQSLTSLAEGESETNKLIES
jgi:hypothetical protein